MNLFLWWTGSPSGGGPTPTAPKRITVSGVTSGQGTVRRATSTQAGAGTVTATTPRIVNAEGE